MNFERMKRMIGNLRTLVRGFFEYFLARHSSGHVKTLQLFYSLRFRATLHMPEKLRRYFLTRSVRLWIDRKAFDRIIKLLHRAHFSIIIQMFIWKNDETGRLVVSTLLQAANRGVKVHIVKEAIGDVFELGQEFIETEKSTDELWQRFWHHPNITVEHKTAHNHAKAFIVDRFILLLTGMNIADEYRFAWHDYLVELRGTYFVDHYLLPDAREESSRVKLVMNTTTAKNVRSEVMSLLRSAKKSIFIEQAYLSDPEVLQLLIQKSLQKVDIVVVLPAHPDIHHHANVQSATQLLHEGLSTHMKVFLYPSMMHGKVILVDHENALIGSVNLIQTSLDNLGEVSVLLLGTPSRLIVRLAGILLRDMLKSRSFHATSPLSFFQRFLAWLKL